MGKKIIDLSSRRLWGNEGEEPTIKPTQPATGRAYRSDEVNPARIVQCREFLGFSQQDFAEILDIPLDTLQSWESGAAQPSVAQLQQIALASGTFTIAWFCHADESGWPGIEETSLRFHGTTEKKKPVQRIQRPISEHDPLGWARDIPQNVGVATCRKPDKCSACATPIWRWYQPDPNQPGEWRCCNCLIYQIKYNKEGALELTLEDCKASGVYRDDYLYYEEER
jgi:transcriptional regulator with XRE-family HTH domain